MGKSPYEGRTLPELYLIASQKGIKDFFPKNEKEMIKYLDEWDSTHEPIKPDKSAPKGKKGFKDHAPDDDLDELIDLEELDEDDVDVSSNQNTHREGADDESDTPKEIEVEDDTDDLLDLDDEDLDDIDLEDEPPEPKPTKGKGKPMADKKPAAAKKKAAPKKEAEKKEAPVNKTAGMSPYSANSAGHYVFIALKKGGLMETIVKNADTLIAKFEVRPPSNTAQKVKIIMAEINKGKRDDKFGRFVLNEKTKKISWTAEV